MSTKVIGYVRVSKVGGREGDSFISPALQGERVAIQPSTRDFTASSGSKTKVCAACGRASGSSSCSETRPTRTAAEQLQGV